MKTNYQDDIQAAAALNPLGWRPDKPKMDRSDDGGGLEAIGSLVAGELGPAGAAATLTGPPANIAYAPFALIPPDARAPAPTAAAPHATISGVAPPAPVITGDTITHVNQAIVVGTAEANVKITVYDGAAVVGTGVAGADGSWSVTTSALPAGANNLTATATDAAGLVSPMSAPFDPVVASPNAIVLENEQAGTPMSVWWVNPGADSTQLQGFTTQIGTDVGGTVQFKIDNLTGNANYTISIYRLGYYGGDGARLITTLQHTGASALVQAAPLVTGDSVVNGNQVTLNGTAEANSTIIVYDGATVVGTGVTSSAGSWSLTTSALASGAQALTATSTDAAGNVSAPSSALSVSIAAATTPQPVVTSAWTAFGDHLRILGTAEANSVVKIFNGQNQLIARTVANASGAFSTLTTSLPPGSYNLYAKSIDSAGNISKLSLPYTASMGSSAISSVVNFTGLTNNGGQSASLMGLAPAGSTVRIFDGNTFLANVTASATGKWSFTTGTLSNTMHTFMAAQIGSSGGIVAMTSGNAVFGTSGSDLFKGTMGRDVFFGAGSIDTYDFSAGFGHEFIADNGIGDNFVFAKTQFASFSDLMSHTTQLGANAVIAVGGDSVTMINTPVSSLTASQFKFV